MSDINDSIEDYFLGKGTKPRGNHVQLPFVDFDRQLDPKYYQASEPLISAVNVALTLGMPLLLTGEPGCGKSELARRIAWELNFPAYNKKNGEPIENGQSIAEGDAQRFVKFVVKSTTEAKDLFYIYDSIGRFQSKQNEEKKEALDFINYQALGLAILRAKGRRGSFPEGTLNAQHKKLLGDERHRSVVLIDEIDKAARDVPNDILSEIEHLEFTIPELGGQRIGLDDADKAYRPVVIITSNSERDLPPAFLRRCVYFHVGFPPFSHTLEEEDMKNKHRIVTVESIVDVRMGKRFRHWPKLLSDALDLCRYLREDHHSLLKKPSLAEILNWLGYLAEAIGIPEDGGEGGDKHFQLNKHDKEHSYLAMKTTLLKTRDDHDRALNLFNDWFKERFGESGA